MHVHEYVLGSYRYVVEPKEWPTIQETIQWGKGDCKGLSLLLMSLLLASGFETHAAVSNGHMWVNVKIGWKMARVGDGQGSSTGPAFIKFRGFTIGRFLKYIKMGLKNEYGNKNDCVRLS